MRRISRPFRVLPAGGWGGEGRQGAARRLCRGAAADCRKIINSGGSKTVLTYADPGAATELSVGSAFVKPTDFDTDTLASLKPAIFIATPALKVVDAMLPGPAWMTSAFRALGLFRGQRLFSLWRPLDGKAGLSAGDAGEQTVGHSSNQQFMSLPDTCDLRDDDLVFFRPTQSEAVLWQFGEIQLFSQGRIVGGWPPIAIHSGMTYRAAYSWIRKPMAVGSNSALSMRKSAPYSANDWK